MTMKLYLAPMEGITGYIYRNAYNKYFGGIDEYITPFISPTNSKILNHRELEDIIPEHNKGIKVIPQILANDAELFIEIAERLKEYGYKEVNLNLGCPSGTVVSKMKGAGLLADLDMLDEFFLKIFNEVNGKMGMDISVKTRIGRDDISEFESIMVIYNQYPIKLLTVHPRVQKELYKGICHLEMFETAVNESKNRLCYNGDIRSSNDLSCVFERFPSVNDYMIGRGIIRNPFIIRDIREKTENVILRDNRENELLQENEKKLLRQFHDELYFSYEEIFSGDRNVLFKMKELWSYMGDIFENSDKALKQIRKATRKDSYFNAINALFG